MVKTWSKLRLWAEKPLTPADKKAAQTFILVRE